MFSLRQFRGSKVTLTISCWLLVSSASFAEGPALFTSSQFNAAMIAEAANHYILVGEERATMELEALSPLEAYSRTSYTGTLTNLEVAERVSWMCMILWTGKPQRPPLYGGLWDVERRFDDQKQWPLYPVVQVGSSYFILSTRYSIGGAAERPRDYLRRCEARGRFRSEMLPVPSRRSAERDVWQLRNSPGWAAAWRDLLPGQKVNPEPEVWNFLWGQAEGIPDKGR